MCPGFNVLMAHLRSGQRTTRLLANTGTFDIDNDIDIDIGSDIDQFTLSLNKWTK